MLYEQRQVAVQQRAEPEIPLRQTLLALHGYHHLHESGPWIFISSIRI